ncbi:hypothetical protein [Nonomuraea sp. NPDC050783]|uniref:hypothetical protein n=1 Tax=Nonomuraea sp. NPDC050783 TaxID=3154634 RepID=UPI00346626BA
MSFKRFAATSCGVLLAACTLATPAHAQDYDWVCLLGAQTFPPVGMNYDLQAYGCNGSGSTNVTIFAGMAHHYCHTAQITNTATRRLWATDCVQIQS